MLVLFVLALGAIVYWRSSSPPAAAVYCSEHTPPTPGTVVMLSNTWCPYCARARAFFSEHAIAFCEYDTEHSARGAALYTHFNGRGVPVIIAGGEVMHGFNPGWIEDVVGGRASVPLRDWPGMRGQ